ncbi:LuxR C-terminal-related transcriptional regulator [Nocardia neocaledoniensis]|uniref:LuxR C-terminal-related transcriptional regulator n=1 Tax=Nocardia neocaledoniensis TaxID=236511 RepID=UPI0033FD9AB3
MVRNTLDPAPTSYLGRDAEFDAVRRLLGGGCLVSVVGSGGLGKTRLARRLAARARADYDEVVFVELAGTRHDAEVAGAVADAFGLRVTARESAGERVLEHLAHRGPLLVLDNCEHLLTACADLVARLVARCPGVTVLATSRQALSVAGERVYRMPALAVPEPGITDPALLAGYPAVALLVDRARAVRPDFRVTAANASDVAELCRLLDGIPLAIELAAARLRALSPRQVVARWSGVLALPTAWSHGVPERHRTVRTTVEWSYRLCTAAERGVWARLSVFQNWFELEAAEHVCAAGDPDAPVLEVIDSLVDKSILETRGDDVVRFRLPQAVREFGAAELAGAHLREETARRHRDWFRALLDLADRAFLSHQQDELVHRLRAAHHDLRLALEWSLTTPGEAETALEMACAVEEYWSLTGADHEARTWLRRALTAAPDAPHAARAWTVLALHSLWLTDRESADRELDRAETATGADDPVVAARLLMVRATAAKIDLDNATAAELAEEALTRFRAQGRLREAMPARTIYALATAAADPVDRLSELHDAVRVCAEHGDYYYRGMMLFAISLIEVMLGRADAAERAARSALEFARRSGSRLGDAYQIEALAWAAAARGRHDRAACLFGVAAEAWARLGADPEIVLVRPHTLFRDATIAALGPGEYAAAFARGRAMPLAEAVALALAPTTVSATAPLTPREYEVATLVADGLTNREIAAKLVIAPRTVDTHVGNILTKLGSANRAQVATWVVTRPRADGA